LNIQLILNFKNTILNTYITDPHICFDIFFLITNILEKTFLTNVTNYMLILV